MKNTTTVTAKVFLTDYASYNEGKQFEYGHWVELDQFSDEYELQEYIDNHFKEAGIEDPEPMFTDFEGFPKQFYDESGCEWDKIFKFIELDFDSMDDSDKVMHWNEMCSETGREDELFTFDEEFFETFFHGRPYEAARAAAFGSMNWSDEYIYFNGYGNLETTDDPSTVIDDTELLNWLIENK